MISEFLLNFKSQKQNLPPRAVKLNRKFTLERHQLCRLVGIFRGFPFRDDFLNIKEKERIFLLFAFVGSFTRPSSIPSSFLGHFFMPSLHKIAPKALKSCVSRLVYFRLFAFSHAKIERAERRRVKVKFLQTRVRST